MFQNHRRDSAATRPISAGESKCPIPLPPNGARGAGAAVGLVDGPMHKADAFEYDLAIIGGGLVGSLLTLALRQYRPEIAFAVVESGPHFGGDFLEAGVVAEIPPALYELIDPLAVKVWPGCFVNYPRRSQHFADEILMLDPRQLHLEIVDHPRAAHCLAGSRVQAVAGKRIVHARGALAARLIVDANDARIQSDLEIERVTRYRDFRLHHDLDLPVLADMSDTAGDWAFLQLFPVDAERIVVEHFRHRAAPNARPETLATGVVIAPDAAESVADWAATDLAAAHFLSLLQVAAELAAGFVELELRDEAELRAFFAGRMREARHRARRMFEFARHCRKGEDGR